MFDFENIDKYIEFLKSNQISDEMREIIVEETKDIPKNVIPHNPPWPIN